MSGRIDIGNFPAPEHVDAQPVIIGPPAAGVLRAPICLYVPPAQPQSWSCHCSRYKACGQPVCSVRENGVWECCEPAPPGGEHGRRGNEGRGAHRGRHGARAVMTMAGTSAVVTDSALEQLAHGVHQQANEADGGGEKGNPLAF
ncbi:MAG: hypothetical protein H7306_26355 [Bacteriovorax sp.]|nr:hypothetical protein [Rhizobacter sp.]